MTNKRLLAVIVTSLLLCWATSSSSQASVYVPPGLNPGDTYQLAFVTAGDHVATSPLISDYNDFVQSEAERSGAFTETFGIDWFAIASTHTVDARDNALVSAPVYLLNGSKIADGFASMWDGAIDVPLGINQFLAVDGFEVWTGSDTGGFEHSNAFGLGTEFSDSFLGIAYESDGSWISGSFASINSPAPFYAMSEKLTVPAPTDGAVPEPASIAAWLCLASLAGLVGAKPRRPA